MHTPHTPELLTEEVTSGPVDWQAHTTHQAQTRREHQAKPAKACPSPCPLSKESIKLQSHRLHQNEPYQLHQTFHVNLIQPADSDICVLCRGHTHHGGAADGDWRRL